MKSQNSPRGLQNLADCCSKLVDIGPKLAEFDPKFGRRPRIGVSFGPSSSKPMFQKDCCATWRSWRPFSERLRHNACAHLRATTHEVLCFCAGARTWCVRARAMQVMTWRPSATQQCINAKPKIEDRALNASPSHLPPDWWWSHRLLARTRSLATTMSEALSPALRFATVARLRARGRASSMVDRPTASLPRSAVRAPLRPQQVARSPSVRGIAPSPSFCDTSHGLSVRDSSYVAAPSSPRCCYEHVPTWDLGLRKQIPDPSR